MNTSNQKLIVALLMTLREWEISSVQLLSATGHMIKEETKEGLTFQMDVNHIQTGIYMLRITRGDEVLYKKIIID